MPETKIQPTNKVIVCDDDPDIINVVMSILQTDGYETIPVENSTQLYQAMDDHQPQLLIVDLWMPLLNGEDIIRKIRSHPVRSATPILLLSASMVGDRVGMQAGADAFLAKPFEMTELLQVVKQLIKKEYKK